MIRSVIVSAKTCSVILYPTIQKSTLYLPCSNVNDVSANRSCSIYSKEVMPNFKCFIIITATHVQMPLIFELK